VCVYLPDIPRFSPIDPQSESMCMSNHPTAVQEYIRTNNYLLGPPHYNRVGKLTVQHYRRARELSWWENLEVHGFNTSSVRGGESKPPAGEVFAVITCGEKPLQIRPDVACRVVPKGSALPMSMMVIQIEAVYATFSDAAQTLVRYILDKMNAKTSSSSMGWIPQTRRYSSTFRSFLDTTQYDLAGRPVPPSQQLVGPRVTSSTATFRPIGGNEGLELSSTVCSSIMRTYLYATMSIKIWDTSSHLKSVFYLVGNF
jgi:hypothetical protein